MDTKFFESGKKYYAELLLEMQGIPASDTASFAAHSRLANTLQNFLSSNAPAGGEAPDRSALLAIVSKREQLGGVPVKRFPGAQELREAHKKKTRGIVTVSPPARAQAASAAPPEGLAVQIKQLQDFVSRSPEQIMAQYGGKSAKTTLAQLAALYNVPPPHEQGIQLATQILEAAKAQLKHLTNA